MTIMEQLVSLENILLSPAIRHCQEQLMQLLSIDFIGIDSHGKRLDRELMIEHLNEYETWEAEFSQVECHEIDHDIQLLIYQVTLKDNEQAFDSYRSSWWRWSGTTWELFFHQISPRRKVSLDE